MEICRRALPRTAHLIYDERRPGFRIDEAHLTGAGGHLAHYGLAGLEPGEPAVNQVFFLEGLCRSARRPSSSPPWSFQTAAPPISISIATDDAVWAILLDVTDQRDAAQRMQQKAYDMTLLQEKEALSTGTWRPPMRR